MRDRRFSWVTAAVVGTCSLVVSPAHAQTELTASAVIQSQATLVRRVFSALASDATEKRLFDLWLADLLLTSNQGPLGPAGVEDVVAEGAFDTLRKLEASDNAEIRSLASVINARPMTELGFADATVGNAVGVDLPESVRVVLNADDYDKWHMIRTRPGLEYEVEARGCPVLKAIVVSAESRRPIAGGTTFGSRFSFIAKGAETALLRIRTPLCTNDNGISLSSGAPTFVLNAARTKDAAQPVTTRDRYRGHLLEGQEQWVRFDAKPGERYEVYATPDDRNLDTLLVVYGANGSEIASDDDGGAEYGSKLSLVSDDVETLRIRVSSIDGSGNYALMIRGMPDPRGQPPR
jgi:hypothetical protein